MGFINSQGGQRAGLTGCRPSPRPHPLSLKKEGHQLSSRHARPRQERGAWVSPRAGSLGTVSPSRLVKLVRQVCQVEKGCPGDGTALPSSPGVPLASQPTAGHSCSCS